MYDNDNGALCDAEASLRRFFDQNMPDIKDATQKTYQLEQTLGRVTGWLFWSRPLAIVLAQGAFIALVLGALHGAYGFLAMMAISLSMLGIALLEKGLGEWKAALSFGTRSPRLRWHFANQGSGLTTGKA